MMLALINGELWGPSPSPVWNVILYSLEFYVFALIFIYWPLAYWFLGRLFGKRFEIKYPTIEKDTWWIDRGIRLVHYTAGILLQSYRQKKNILTRSRGKI